MIKLLVKSCVFVLPVFSLADVLIDQPEPKTLFIDEGVVKPKIKRKVSTNTSSTSFVSKYGVSTIRTEQGLVVTGPIKAGVGIVAKENVNNTDKMEEKSPVSLDKTSATTVNATATVSNDRKEIEVKPIVAITEMKQEDKTEQIKSHNMSQKVKLVPIDADFSKYGYSKKDEATLVKPIDFAKNTRKDLLKQVEERKNAEREVQEGLDKTIDKFFGD